MNSNTTNEENKLQPVQEQEIDLLELAKKVWDSRKLILKVCGIGAVIGLVIGFSTPKEYTSKILIAPESTSKSSSSGMSALRQWRVSVWGPHRAGMPFIRTCIGHCELHPVPHRSFRHKRARK